MANRLTRSQVFLLRDAVIAWLKLKADPFQSWKSAEQYFTKTAGFSVTSSHIESNCDADGIPIHMVVDSPRANTTYADLTRRVELLEKRLDDLTADN